MSALGEMHKHTGTFPSPSAFHCMSKGERTFDHNVQYLPQKKEEMRSAGIIPLIFMSFSSERAPQPKTELTHKTRRNKAHQHTEAAVRGTILEL